MEKSINKLSEREILPKDLSEYYVRARKNTFASGKKPVMNLYLPNFWGYEYHENVSPYYYQDNYFDSKDRPGNFSGIEIISKDNFESTFLTTYNYGGGLTEEGMEEGESAVYSRLTTFLKVHAEEVRFGKNVSFSFEDEDGEWVYKGEGEITSMCWEDKEEILHNGKKVYELTGVGMSFIEGY